MAIDVVVQHAAGLDIAKASLVACTRVPGGGTGWKIDKRKFSTTTAGLMQLADWLAEHNVTRVGMESTSSYWKPVFYLLEQRFECWLLNARHMRMVPGRKTYMIDAEWICDLVAGHEMACSGYERTDCPSEQRPAPRPRELPRNSLGHCGRHGRA